MKKVGWIQPWIRENEIQDVADYREGGVCDVFDSSKNYVGRGYINRRSWITVRLLSRSPVKIDRDFFAERIAKALDSRKGFGTAFRMIHSEADDLSGLVVDRYGDHLVAQFNTLGMEILKNEILDALEEVVCPSGIFEKSESGARKREGLESSVGWLRGNGEELIPFEMDGVKYFSDTLGQKTGFFLDQRLNLLASRNFAKGEMLDAFSYTGAFSVNALKAGAERIIVNDYSSRAVGIAAKTIDANGFGERYETKNENAFDLLRKYSDENRSFDTIVLDPPGFAKGRKDVDSALRGYKEINLRAMKLLKDGGHLVSASCSGAVKREIFLKTIKDAASDAHKKVTVEHFGVQSYDHPVVVGMDESDYLKFFIFRVEAI